MSDKVTLGSVANIDNSLLSTINNNNALITTAFDNTLSRDGTTPNQMSANFDMNSFQILNLPAPGSINSPLRLADVAVFSQPVNIITANTGTSGHTVPFLDGNNTWSGVNTFNAGILGTNSNPSSITSGNVFNQIAVSAENLDASGVGNVADAFSVYMGSGGTSTKGARQAFQSTFQLLTPTSTTNTNRFYVAGVFTAQAVSNDGGGVGTEKGSIFGGNSTAILNAAATNMAELCCHEFNTTAITGSTVLDKWGLSVVQTSNDSVTGSRNDAAIRIVNQAGSTNWKNGIQFGDGINQFPIKASGTILKTGSGTVTAGIDLTSTTFSTSSFTSPGFGVTGTGAIVTGGPGTSTGQINFNGVTSGLVSLIGSATGVLLTVTQPVQIGVIGTTAGQLTLAGQTSGSAILSSSATGGTLQLGAGNLTVDTSGNLSTAGSSKIGNATAPVAGGDTSHAYLFGTLSNFGIFYGSGPPTITAAQGSIYLNTTGSSTSTRLYVNTTGSTTWANFTSSA